MTVTIDIPDAGHEAAKAEETVDAATLDVLRAGFADIDAGRTLTLEEANARFEQDLAEAHIRLQKTTAH